MFIIKTLFIIIIDNMSQTSSSIVSVAASTKPLVSISHLDIAKEFSAKAQLLNFNNTVARANNEKLLHEEGYVHLVWNDGSINITKCGSLWSLRNLKILPEWEAWDTEERCAHILLPVKHPNATSKYSYAVVSELDAYKIRNLIRMLLDTKCEQKRIGRKTPDKFEPYINPHYTTQNTSLEKSSQILFQAINCIYSVMKSITNNLKHYIEDDEWCNDWYDTKHLNIRYNATKYDVIIVIRCLDPEWIELYEKLGMQLQWLLNSSNRCEGKMLIGLDVNRARIMENIVHCLEKNINIDESSIISVTNNSQTIMFWMAGKKYVIDIKIL